MVAHISPVIDQPMETEQKPLSLQTLYTRLELFRREKFTGLITLASGSIQPWKLSFFMGRLIYATGGGHPLRRWQRQVMLACPQLESEQLTQLITGAQEKLGKFWEHQLLTLWIDQGRLSRDQSIHIITGIVEEVFFDIIQAGRMTLGYEDADNLPRQIALLDPLQVIKDQILVWKQWQTGKAADRSPNLSPQIVKPEQLRESVSVKLFTTLSTLLDGHRTVRDIAIQMKRTPLEVMLSLLPYMQTGVLDLVEVDDLVPAEPQIPTTHPHSPNGPLIACIDDSAWVCQSLEKLMVEAGYRFLAIQDPLRAMALLLVQKPALILLDLRMPNTNGYELCAQLRRLTLFQETPILILTGNDGLVDRVRAKMVGATDFLSKSVDDETLLTTIRKYLPVSRRDTA